MVVAVVLFRTDASSSQGWPASFGNADAVLHPYGDGATAPDFDTSELPAGSRVAWVASLDARVRADDGRRSDLSVRGYPADEPLTDGLVDVVAGRLPSAGDEVALSPAAADALGVTVGDRLALDAPDIELAVVGLVENPENLRQHVAVTPDVRQFGRPRSVSVYGLVDLPAGTDLPAVQAAHPNLSVRWPAPTVDDRSVPVTWSYVLGGHVLTVVGIVIAAAFTAGARRQLTTLGQLSANGATAAVLRAMLGLQGTVTGIVGSLAGVALAFGGLALVGRERIEETIGHRLPGFDIRPADIALAAMVGVVAATVAALVPARTITRIPTLTALAGRRPMPPVRRRVVVAGTAAVVVGLALLGVAVIGARPGRDREMWAGVAIAGGVLELLGTCAVAPKVVSFMEPLAARTKGAWRLASRSLARQRSRTGAVVSAVAAAAGLAVAAAALVAGANAGDTEPVVPDDVVVANVVGTTEQGGEMSAGGRLDLAPPPEDVAAEIERVVSVEPVVVRMAGTVDDWIDAPVPVMADAALLDAFGAGDDVRDALDEVGFVAVRHPQLIGEDMPVGAGGPEPPGLNVIYGPATRVTLPDGSPHDIVTVAGRVDVVGGWGWNLIAPDLAEDLGVVVTEATSLYHSPEPLDAAQRDDLDILREDVAGGLYTTTLDQWLELRVGGEDDPVVTPNHIGLILAGVALLFSVLVVGASLALAAAEARDEREVLSVAGAAPGTLARGAGARAWLLAGTGAAMAVPAGLLPVAVFVAAGDGTTRFVVPWPTVGVLLVALPLVAAAVALATSTVAQHARPVRISTAMFE